MKNKFLFAVVVVVCLIIFRSWFSFSGTLSSGDWPYFYQSALQNFPSGVGYYHARWGVGETNLLFASLETYFQQTARVFSQFMSWEIIERVFWFYPFLIFSLISSYKFTKSIIGALIYTTNTYVLMLVSGGQMGVAMAYAITPLVLYACFDLISDTVSMSFFSIKKLRFRLVLSSFLVAILIHFDPRIAYISFLILISFLIFSVLKSHKSVVSFLRAGIVMSVPFFTAFLLHSFWLVPMLLYGVGPSDYGNTMNFSRGSVEFFSFSDFSHSLSLLHPNWPENVFGKVSFMQPEYLILPFLAFLPLFFLQPGSNKTESRVRISILFFSLLGLSGAFLAKGASEPFGFVYLWMFQYVPGFVVFRDPTKFYIVVAIAYSVLIPISLRVLSTYISDRKWLRLSSERILLCVLTVFIIIWCILIRESFFGGVKGTLSGMVVPNEYRSFAAFIESDTSFFRVLWFPAHQRFGYYSDNHPAVSASEYFQTSSDDKLIAKLSDGKYLRQLSESSVRYVVVPLDSRRELFLEDRKYSGEKRDSLIRKLDRIKGLQRVTRFSELAVYELGGVRSHFWLTSDKSFRWEKHSPTSYKVYLDSASAEDTLIFTDAYSRFWRVSEGKEASPTLRGNGGLNKVTLKDGSYSVEVYHVLERPIAEWTLVSGFVAVLLLGSVFVRYKKKEVKD